VTLETARELLSFVSLRLEQNAMKRTGPEKKLILDLSRDILELSARCGTLGTHLNDR
jgi:hypothetical protein